MRTQADRSAVVRLRGPACVMRLSYAGFCAFFLLVVGILVAQNEWSLVAAWNMRPDPLGQQGVVRFFLILCLVGCVPILVRMPFLGSRIEGDVLVIGSWWRTYRIHRSELVGCRMVWYNGLGVQTAGMYLRCLELTFVESWSTWYSTDVRSRDYPGTLSRRRRAMMNAEIVQAWIDGAQPRDEGES